MDLRLLKENLLTGFFNQRLKAVYVVSDAELSTVVERYCAALTAFEELYGNADVAIYSAPGRTEVGGNHTDHQHGKVLAAAVNMDALAVVAKTSDNLVTMVSEGYEVPVLDLSDLAIKEEEKFTTAALIRGVCGKFKAEGYTIGGFNAYCTSTVLKGSGISSSAAFEVLIGVILNNEYNQEKVSPVKVAQIAQYSENVYFGKPCGLMDQMASSVGGFVFIDFADNDKPLVRKVEFDIAASGYRLCLVDTGGNHADLSSEYGLMVSDMKAVAQVFGKEFLVEVKVEDFFNNIAAIRATCDDRAILRAWHFFNDDSRVPALVVDLQHNNLSGFFDKVKASGRSSFMYLQNVFCVKTPQEQGLALALALSEKILGDQGAYRVHGGGLAGTIQAYVPQELAEQYSAELEAVFGAGSCHFLAIRPFGGIRVI